MNIGRFMNQEYFGNTIREYGIALGIVVLGFLALFITRTIVLKRIKRIAEGTTNNIDDFLIGTIERNVLPFLYTGCIYISIQVLSIPARYMKFIDNTWMVIFTFFIIRMIASFVNFLLMGYVKRRYPDRDRGKEVKGLLLVLNVILWSLGIVFLLDNLGYNITTVITGLGIGGIAVALAAQAILGDLFGYFVIFFDKPFETGDFIIVENKMGTIETIGIKTTRVRSLGGEEIIFSNKDLTDSRIHNYKRMQRRRIVFRFGVEYSTPPALLESIPGMIKEAILVAGDTSFDRAHFASFGESSLDFEVVYYIETDDYNTYMDKQQAINLALVRDFSDNGIVFAFPTRTIIIPEAGAGMDKKK